VEIFKTTDTIDGEFSTLGESVEEAYKWGKCLYEIYREVEGKENSGYKGG
jgi:hypothetical protein